MSGAFCPTDKLGGFELIGTKSKKAAINKLILSMRDIKRTFFNEKKIAVSEVSGSCSFRK